MSLEDAMRQTTRQLELPFDWRGETSIVERSGEASTANHGNERSGSNGECLMELVVERSNAITALKRVQSNKGSPGIDGMIVQELSKYLKENWPSVRAQLLAGTYQPRPVRRQSIPKNGGGTRELGIPCVLDRFIQQAILQVLQPRFDPTFSEHSYGFRPGRRAHDAVRAAQAYIQEGRRWVVDVDLEKFFDRVNHDVLMGRLAHRIADRRMLGLIRRYLEAGILADGVVIERHEGTPQGGPLSPILANVLLDEVDKELEKRGYAFARYADDCNVYVRSRHAAERAMNTLRRLYAKLRLRINESKSTIGRPWDRKFLGYSFWAAKGNTVKLRIAEKSRETMKTRVRQLTRRTRGRSIPSVIAELRVFLTGWKNYFQLAQTPGIFRGLDEWIGHRLRALQLKQWKNGTTIFSELRARGLNERDAKAMACCTGHWWRYASNPSIGIALPSSYFEQLGLPKLAADLNSPNRRMRTRTSGGVGGA